MNLRAMCAVIIIMYLLNREVSPQEVEVATKDMKSGKATGPDGIKAEMLKSCADLLSPYLVIVHNNILTNEVYPADGAKGLIVPLHKKGDINSVSNYTRLQTFAAL